VLSGVIDIGTIVTTDNYCVGHRPDSVPNQTGYKQTEEPPSKTSYHFMYSLGSGDVVGHLESFTGEISAISARAAEHSILLKVPKRSYDVILSTDPRSLAKTLWCILHDFISPVAHLLDWGIDWLHLRAGDKLVAEGQPCTCFYMVMAGRLRSEISTSKNKFNRSGYKDFGKGACLGDIEILTGAAWPGDTYAVRNSELAVIPDFILEFIFTRFPASGFHFAKVIARQVQSFYSAESFERKASGVASGIYYDNGSNNSSCPSFILL
jgi:lysophospholipid hydrolase